MISDYFITSFSMANYQLKNWIAKSVIDFVKDFATD